MQILSVMASVVGGDGFCLRSRWPVLLVSFSLSAALALNAREAHERERGVTCRRGDGAPTTSIKVKALARMKNWLCLAKAAVRAEFADFDIKMAFSVFDVETRCGGGDTNENVAKEPCCCKT